MKLLTFGVVLRRMSSLPKVLMLMSRLGGEVTYVSAADGQATIAVRAPKHSAHRFGPQIERIVDVQHSAELHVVGSREPGSDAQTAARRKPA